MFASLIRVNAIKGYGHIPVHSLYGGNYVSMKNNEHEFAFQYVTGILYFYRQKMCNRAYVRLRFNYVQSCTKCWVSRVSNIDAYVSINFLFDLVQYIDLIMI